MDRSEPALAPEWLRSAGSATGGGNSAHHLPSSSHSDISSHNHKSRTSKISGDFDTPRSAFLDRSYSANTQRNLRSNGSAKHAYSSFSRSHRERDREKDKERSGFGDHWDHESDPLGHFLPNRIENDVLRRSQSTISKRPSEFLVRKGPVDLKNGDGSKHYGGNGMLAGSTVGGGIQKAVLDKDFPALGSEERQGVSDIGRVSSPGLSAVVQSLPVGSSALIGGEKWSSALAEVPKNIGSVNMNSSSVQQNATSGAGQGSLSATTGLNMAEALVQPPSRARTPPQSSVKTQRLEELAIRQSKQLIPVTPSLPKTSGLNSSDKLKPKTAGRAAEANVAVKSSPQPPSSFHSANQSLGGGHAKSDTPKKFLVLKPVRENGLAASPNDVTIPSNVGNKVASNQSTAAPLVASAPLRGAGNPKGSTVDRRAAPLAMNPGSTVEKRPSSSQAQSRNEFFNLMRKKCSMKTVSDVHESTATSSSTSMEKSAEVTKEKGGASFSSHVTENGGNSTGNGHASGVAQNLSDDENNGVSPKIALYSEEKEAAFLRSLGWDENDGEGGLTEEEINGFYERCRKLNLKPSLLCRDMQLRLSISESHAGSLGGAASEFGTPDSRSKA